MLIFRLESRWLDNWNLHTAFRMLGLFTIKPLVATPFYFIVAEMIIARKWTNAGSAFCLLSIPGIVLTILILVQYRHLLIKRNAFTLFLLIALDSIRWASSSLAAITASEFGTNIFLVLSYAMPVIFAVIALLIVLSFPERFS